MNGQNDEPQDAPPHTKEEPGNMRGTRDLRTESKELVRILTDADLDSVADIRELGRHVARLAALVDEVIQRLDERSDKGAVTRSPSADRSSTYPPAAPTDRTSSPTFAGKRALVVDDDLSSRRLMARVLDREGFTSDSAASVSEARGLLDKNRYALLVTDMRMWGEEGLDLVRFATEKYPDMAAIMVSGMDDADLAKKAVQAGAFSYIQKPIDLEDFSTKVADALDAREDAIKLRKHRG